MESVVETGSSGDDDGLLDEDIPDDNLLDDAVLDYTEDILEETTNEQQVDLVTDDKPMSSKHSVSVSAFLMSYTGVEQCDAFSAVVSYKQVLVLINSNDL